MTDNGLAALPAASRRARGRRGARRGPPRRDLLDLGAVCIIESAVVSDRENLFKPVHKGIRAMVYELGLRLGVTDFTSVKESNEIALQLKHDLIDSRANCILCLLYAHSRHEEKDFFSAMVPFDKELVELMMGEHRDLGKQIAELGKTCDELVGLTDRARRIEVGDRLCLEANDLFAAYLAHLNNEEATLVPAMWERFTDEQLRAFRAQFYNHVPLPRFEEWMRWTLPALNPEELEILLKGMRTDPAPNRYRDVLRVAEATLPADRWGPIRARLDSSASATG
jgi:hypothetical protein